MKCNLFPSRIAELINDKRTFIDSTNNQINTIFRSNIRLRTNENNIIDIVYGAANLDSDGYDDAYALVWLAKNEVVAQICEAIGIEKPYMDGSQWCILKGKNIQEGTCGFGDTIVDAFIDFLKNYNK